MDFAGIAIGGDVFPGSTLSDHVLRCNNIPHVIDLIESYFERKSRYVLYSSEPRIYSFFEFYQVKMIVVLAEVGGQDEYSLVEALKQGKINKPVVA